jgi:hypothetical protein
MNKVLAFGALALIVAGALLVSVGYGAFPLSISYYTYFQVRDHDTSQGIAGATITLNNGVRLTTDWAGTAYIEAQASSYTVAKAGYVTQSGTISYSPTGVAQIQIYMVKTSSPPVDPRNSLVTVTVVGSGATTPAAGAHTYTVGDDINVAASASSGWTYYGTYRNGVLWTQENPAEILDVQAAENVTVYFTEDSNPEPPPDILPTTPSWKTWLKDNGSVTGFSLIGVGAVAGLTSRKKPKNT